MKYQTISLKQFYPAKGAIYYVAIATVIFSHVKITCFRVKAHLVFHGIYIMKHVTRGLVCIFYYK